MSSEVETTITELVDDFLRAQRERNALESGSMTFVSSVQAFIATADWLGAEHMPSVVALLSLADKLDLEVTAAMAGQFGVTFRDLRSQAPGGSLDDDDPLEADLRRAGK